MRPRKDKPDNRKGKKTLNKLLRKSRNRLCYLRNVNHKEGSDIEETFNNIIREHKSQAKVVKHYKLAPKDSCEVYKDRYKRKVEDDTETNEKREDTDKNSNKTKKRVKRRPLKRDSRGRFLPETPSTNCSCSKCAESIYSDDQ